MVFIENKIRELLVLKMDEICMLLMRLFAIATWKIILLFNKERKSLV